MQLQVGGFSRCGRINARVDVDGLCAWFGDVYDVGTTSRAVICLERCTSWGEYSLRSCERTQNSRVASYRENQERSSETTGNHARANDGDANRVKPRIVSIELTRMRDAALAVDSLVIDLCK